LVKMYPVGNFSSKKYPANTSAIMSVQSRFQPVSPAGSALVSTRVPPQSRTANVPNGFPTPRVHRRRTRLTPLYPAIPQIAFFHPGPTSAGTLPLFQMTRPYSVRPPLLDAHQQSGWRKSNASRMPLDSAIISSHSFYDSMCHRRRDCRYRSGRREWIKVKNRAHPSRLDRDGRTKTINKRYGIVTKSEPEMPMNTPSRRTCWPTPPP